MVWTFIKTQASENCAYSANSSACAVIANLANQHGFCLKEDKIVSFRLLWTSNDPWLRMLSTFQIRVMVLIVALSHGVGNSLIYSPGSEIQCKWNCFVHMADLTVLKREMANSTTTNNILIKLSVRYEKLIDDKCTNEKSVNSSESAFDHCQVCLVNKRLFPSMTSNESSIIPFLHVEHREIRAICTLKPARTTVSRDRKSVV